MDGYQLLLALHKVVKEKVYGNNGSGVEVDIEASYTQ